LDRIDAMGGMLEAVQQGWVQREIQEAAWNHQQAVEQEETLIVGVNAFREGDEATEILEIPEQLEAEQVERLKTLRDERDGQAVEEAIAALKQAAEGEGNLMPLIIDAVRKEATLGEVCHALRDVWGEYQDPSAGI
ncbi:MAG: methylmalonyl-CoA mutase family protein, partial [Candidatus Thermoplasmatota archaeon]|nr:methylmalonyl-CoA mutase family protein [Candidatus Thermoplasmatota archaeon]